MQITVTLKRMLCAKKESGWYLFRAEVEDDIGVQSLICKGAMAWEPQEMETLTITGEYVEYKGEKQFQFTGAKLTLPVDPRSRLHYIAERTYGVGAALEQKIWDAAGENFPSLEFGVIRGMRRNVFDKFMEQIKRFGENKEHAEVIAFLESHGCTPTMASAAWEEWGADAPGKVNADCYCLAQLDGFSFKTVDENVRGTFGITDHDPRRITAAMRYSYDLASQENGDTAIPWAAWYSNAAKLLPDLEEAGIAEAGKDMIGRGVFTLFDNDTISSQDDFNAERIIRNFVDSDIDCGGRFVSDELLAEGESFTPDAGQLDAVRFAVGHRFSIVNGGAGVGKTTVIRMIVRGLKASGVKSVLLCAPTGKAAARLKEASNLEASTIHSMLGYNGKRFTVTDLEGSAVIVDESSMVDSALMAALMRCKPARLVLVGDQAQLTPVGKGQPFHDLINLHPEAVRTLSKCYRNQEAVYQAASAIRQGVRPVSNAESKKESWLVVPVKDAKAAQASIANWAADGLIDFSTDIVLAPKNGEVDASGNILPATVNSLNDELLKIDRVLRGCGLSKERFVPGDRVINTKNFPEAKIWNGTTGTVHAVDEEGIYLQLDTPIDDGEGKVEFVRCDREMVKELRYAYALTVHKSQGSQFRRVVMICLDRDQRMLDRSMLYTGVTRTKAECVVVGSYAALCRGINNIKHKTTALQAWK